MAGNPQIPPRNQNAKRSDPGKGTDRLLHFNTPLGDGTVGTETIYTGPISRDKKYYKVWKDSGSKKSFIKWVNSYESSPVRKYRWDGTGKKWVLTYDSGLWPEDFEYTDSGIKKK